MAVTIPKFDSLPLDKTHPPHSAWNVWPNSLGTMNHLTPAAVLVAKEEIQTGERVSLDLPIGVPNHPICGRTTFEHTLVRTGKGSYDDIVHFNTQQGSQWDGLQHNAYDNGDGRYLLYNGVDINDVEGGRQTKELGIHIWAERGIVGRGVLLDFAAYVDRHALKYNALDPYGITAEELRAVAEEQKVVFKEGDLLFIRFGYTKEMSTKSDAEAKKIADELVAYAGLAQGPDTLRFLWDGHFAAAAGDGPTFERHPPVGPMLHQPLLAGFGLSIGELFNLEPLAAKCAELGRWSFFVTSAPLYVIGGAASPPNAIAIF